MQIIILFTKFGNNLFMTYQLLSIFFSILQIPLFILSTIKSKDLLLT